MKPTSFHYYHDEIYNSKAQDVSLILSENQIPAWSNQISLRCSSTQSPLSFSSNSSPVAEYQGILLN